MVPPTLISGVGYHDLRDYSVGPWVARTLAADGWPPEIAVENHSYNPVAVVHRLQEEEPRFERWIVAGSARRGREPGSSVLYRWDGELPGDEEVQARVAEAVTGVVDLDNLLIVAAAFEAAPPVVVVAEVEPEVEAFGREFTPAVRAGGEELVRRVRRLALGETDPSGLPLSPLGGFGSGNGSARGTPESEGA